MSFNILLLQIVSFLDMFAVALIVPLVTAHVRTLGAGHIYVGILGAIYPACQLVSGTLIGSLSDLKGRRMVLIMTLLLCAVCQTFLGFINSLCFILIVRGILGLFKQTDVLIKALVPDYETNKKKQSEIFGKIAAMSGIGMIVGPFVGGHLAEGFPEHVLPLVAIIAGGCFSVSAGLVYLLPNSKHDEKQKSKGSTSKKNGSTTVIQIALNVCKETVLELFKIDWSKYGTIFLFVVLLDFTILLHFSNYVYYLKTTYGLTPKSIGYIISLKGLIRSMSSYLIGFINSFYTKDKKIRTRNAHAFLATSMSMLGFIFSFNIYIYVIFMIPLGISEAVAKLVFLEMVLKRGLGEHRSTLIGATNSVRSMSGVIAPIVSGVIAQYLGVPFVIYVAFFISLLGSLISYRHTNIVKED
ncbi:major facilitator superfamily domain-containing protein 9-like [Cydia fagiglandana]|uniref:major facilitator superfamily domain-containing protein 9-like n=1 Tax=Cydia fagiglandana TaxID=1458189 RepID=UPI002FEE39B2